jgi:predicted AAA+ superfamily ATPase
MSQQTLKAIWDWNPWFEGSFPSELSGYARDYDILQYLQIPEIKILKGPGALVKAPCCIKSFDTYLSRAKRCYTQKEIVIKKHFDDYLRLGAFPAMTLRTVYQKELLISYFEDFVYKDIATRYNVNANKLKDLGLYLATNSAKLFSYRSIAAPLGIHPSTIVDYFSYYQEVFLFSEMYKFDYSLHGQFGSEKKNILS